MSDLETKNTLIKSVSLSVEDHGCLSGWLHLDYGDSGQGFGGYALYRPKYKSAGAGLWIWRILEVTGVGKWEDLPGTVVRVKSKHSGVEALGHALKDKWFWPREEFRVLDKEAKESN